jgi:predicted Zn-dependent protease
MTELELALMDAKQVWLNAGDADGNAEAARLALEQGANIPRAIEALTLAKEQAERTAILAARTLARLRAMTPNVQGNRPLPAKGEKE